MISTLPAILSDLTEEQKEAYHRAMEISRQLVAIDNKFLQPLKEEVIVREMIYQQKLMADVVLGKHWTN
jgi:hypothetical protein